MLECGSFREDRSSLTKDAVRVLLEQTLLECDITVSAKDYEKWARSPSNKPEVVPTRKMPPQKSYSRSDLEEEKRKEKEVEEEDDQARAERKVLRGREALCPIKVSLDPLQMLNHPPPPPGDPHALMRADIDGLEEFSAARALSKDLCDIPKHATYPTRAAPLLSDPLVAIKGVLRRLPPEIVAEALRVSVAANESAAPGAVQESEPLLQPRPAPRFSMQNVRPRKKTYWPSSNAQPCLLPNVKGATVSRSSMGPEP